MSTWKKVLILCMILHQTTANRTQRSCGPIFETEMITLNAIIPLEYIGPNEEDRCICRELPYKFSACFSVVDLKIPCNKFPRNMKLLTPALLIETTRIEKLEFGDFDFFTHLKVLAINGNQKFRQVDPYVFENMTNLISLSFIFNPSLTYLHPNSFRGLVNLKELNLMKNGFNSIGMLVQTLKPTIIPSLCRLNLNENKFVNISEHDFALMEGSALVELDINLCRIENIHPRSLKSLKYLEILRIGNNRMNSHILWKLLNDTLRMGIDVRSLDLYSSGFRASLPVPLLKVLSQSNISSLVLSRNQFDIIDNKTFPILIPTLVSLDLSDVSLQLTDANAFSALPNLKTLLLGKNRLPHFSASRKLSKLAHLDLRENSGAHGSEFSMSNSKFQRFLLEHLDLQHTPLIFLKKTDFANMTQLNILNLQNCSIMGMDDFVFYDMKNLTYLNLENNKLFYISQKIPANIWSGLESLEELLLGGNGIFKITGPTGYLFEHLKSLKYLGLERNSITSIHPTDFAPLVNLKVLDISYNYLVSWDNRVFVNNTLKEFRSTANKLTYLSDAMVQDLRNLTSIEISYNSFICDCRIMNKMSTNNSALTAFSKLINEQNVLCDKSSNKTLSNFIRNITNSVLNCDKRISSLVFIIPSCVFFILGVVIGVLGYRYRWQIRYWAFLVKLYLIRKGKAKNVTGDRYEKDYQFDAFVSYCSQDRNFVLDLVEMLENYEPFLKLCVYERDFQVGSVISESIRENIDKSRKTLLVVSNSYAKSHWCTWETQIAEHHRLFSEKPCEESVDDSIVLIKLGVVDGVHLTPTLKYLLKTRIYLQWQVRDDEHVVFWRKLRQVLAPPENPNVEDTRL